MLLSSVNNNPQRYCDPPPPRHIGARSFQRLALPQGLQGLSKVYVGDYGEGGEGVALLPDQGVTLGKSL